MEPMEPSAIDIWWAATEACTAPEVHRGAQPMSWSMQPPWQNGRMATWPFSPRIWKTMLKGHRALPKLTKCIQILDATPWNHPIKWWFPVPQATLEAPRWCPSPPALNGPQIVMIGCLATWCARGSQDFCSSWVCAFMKGYLRQAENPTGKLIM